MAVPDVEMGMQMGQWISVFWKTGSCPLAHPTYLDLRMGPPHHQLLGQSQLAVETLDGLLCFLSGERLQLVESPNARPATDSQGPHQL